MKILFVNNVLEVGGIETNLVRLTRELTGRGHEVIVAARTGRLEAAVRAVGGRVELLHVAARPLAMLRDVQRLRRLLDAERPDVVHVFSAASALLAWPVLRR